VENNLKRNTSSQKIRYVFEALLSEGGLSVYILLPAVVVFFIIMSLPDLS
jgi:Flp pilus assembly protein TadB